MKRKCSVKHGVQRQGENKLKDLKNALEQFRKSLKKEGQFFYLGGNGEVGCGGNSGVDVCARYQNKKGMADIPWAGKMLQEVMKIQESEKNRSIAVHSSKTSGPFAISGENEVDVVHDAHSTAPDLEDHITGKKDDRIREEEPETQAKKHEELRRSTEIKSTKNNNEPQLGDPNPASRLRPQRDGSLLTHSQLILLAALLK
ncbi:unnamed protein product [Trypanosoma congolense IL3000]|uniref:WGS project CAEQ00000000 data, annotated contig 2236 n=1 Tax=Trypanosoma congolense (strain IL3000) TaxID=1068625 RepID=F9WCI7_TRYCI|nr:unnamed protein product [Trypanosoma congolense IL3000]